MRFQGTVTGIPQARVYLNQQGQRAGQNFLKEVSNRARRLANQMQVDLNAAIAGGPVPFTSNAILFRFKRTSTGAVNEIIVKDYQAKYLHDIIVKPRNQVKIVPTSVAKLTAQGNISAMKSGIRNGKYKIVDSGGKKRMIDTTKKGKKNRSKRVVGVREVKKRKMVYDFYANAEAGARLILSDLQGQYIFRRM